MTNPLLHQLGELEALSADPQVVPGPWNMIEARHLTHVEQDGTGRGVFSSPSRASTRLCVASVNFLRANIPALRQALEDQARYWWLKESDDEPYISESGGADIGDRADERIDAAMARGASAPDGWCEICGGQDGEHKSGCGLMPGDGPP